MTEKVSVKSDTSFITRVKYLSFCSMGIYKDKTFGVVYSSLFLLSTAFGTIGSTIGFLNNNNPADKLEILSTIQSQLIASAIFIVLKLSSGKISRLLAKLEGKQQDNIEDVRSQTDAFVKKNLFWYFNVFGAQGAVFTLTTIFSMISTNEISDKYSQFIPFWFSCGDHNSNKILQYVCWKTTTEAELLWKNTVEVMITTWVTTTFLMTFALYCVMNGELVMLLERIKEKVNDFVKEAQVIDEVYKMSKSSTKERLDFYEEKLYQKFLQITQYQRFLHTCTEEAVDSWKGYIFFLYSGYVIGMTLFCFITITEIEDAKLYAMRCAMVAALPSVIVFYVAYYAEVSSHFNEKFIDHLLEIPWYRRSIKFRKVYILALTLNRIEVPVTIAGIFELNVDRFSRTCKAVYSILNLIILKYG